MIFRFLIAGGISFATNVSILYVLTHYAGMWYLASAIISFTASILVSFVVQKYWTFKDFSRDRLAEQSFRYAFICLGNLGLNTLTIFVLVDIVGAWYIAAAVIASIIVAISGFVFYRKFVFID